MLRKRKKLFCILIILMTLSLFLSSCNGKGTDADTQANVKNYHYIENLYVDGSSISVTSQKVISSGELVAYIASANEGKGKYIVYDTQGNVKKEYNPDLSGTGGVFAIDSDNSLYLIESVTDMEKGSSSYKLKKYGADGAFIKETVIEAKQDGNVRAGNSNTGGNFMGGGNFSSFMSGITDMEVSKNGKLYLMSMSGTIDVYSTECIYEKTLETAASQIEISADDNLIINTSASLGGIVMGGGSGGNESYIKKIDPSNESVIWEYKLPSNGGGNMGMSVSIGGAGGNSTMTVGLDGNIYRITDSGIDKLSGDGKETETVLEFKDCEFYAANLTADSIACDANGSLYILAQGQSGNGMGGGGVRVSLGVDSGTQASIYMFEKISGSAVAKTQITFSIQNPSRYYQLAASKFTKKFPEYEIVFKGSSQNRDDFMTETDTELMAGKGSDIISMSDMPFNKYISKNMLLDINSMIKNDSSFNISDYNSGIMNSMTQNGSLYIMPLAYSFDALMVSSPKASEFGISGGLKISDLISLSEKVTDKYGDGMTLFPQTEYDELLNYILRSSIDYFADISTGTQKFNSDEFINLLETVKALGVENTSGSGFGGRRMNFMDLFDRDATLFVAQSFSDYMNFGFMSAIAADGLDLLSIPSVDGDSKTGFTSSMLVAINAKSKHADMAYEYLKILLSEEMQSSGEIRGFPVNSTSLESMRNQIIENFQNNTMAVNVNGQTIELSKINNETLSKLDKFTGNIVKFNYMDSQITSIIQEETKNFFSGSKSAKDTANMIATRVETYLGE